MPPSPAASAHRFDQAAAQLARLQQLQVRISSLRRAVSRKRIRPCRWSCSDSPRRRSPLGSRNVRRRASVKSLSSTTACKAVRLKLWCKKKCTHGKWHGMLMHHLCRLLVWQPCWHHPSPAGPRCRQRQGQRPAASAPLQPSRPESQSSPSSCCRGKAGSKSAVTSRPRGRQMSRRRRRRRRQGRRRRPLAARKRLHCLTHVKQRRCGRLHTALHGTWRPCS